MPAEDRILVSYYLAKISVIFASYFFLCPYLTLVYKSRMVVSGMIVGQ